MKRFAQYDLIVSPITQISAYRQSNFTHRSLSPERFKVEIPTAVFPDEEGVCDELSFDIGDAFSREDRISPSRIRRPV